MSVPFRRSGFFLLLFSCSLLGGCSGCTGNGTTVKVSKANTEDPLVLARELYRGATEFPQFRDANERTNTFLAANPDALARHYPGSQDKEKLRAILRKQAGVDVDKLDDHALYRKFLETTIGLDAAEIEEVENPTFKLMDGNYLEGCSLFREVARSMPLQGLSPLEQSQFCFDWVMRQVLLQENRSELLPPQYILRLGTGNAAERAFVFLSLLQQLTPSPETKAPHLDACLIALRGKKGPPRPWLVGILIETPNQHDVYLFDPRLGVPVPGPKGKGIATLAQLRDNPAAVLDGLKIAGDGLKYDVDANEAAQAEILLACPLSGLSARMRYLEDELLVGLDRLNLAVRAADLVDKFEKLNAGPVRVWNLPLSLQRQTPTRALRLFLPPEEGGIDNKKRLEAFQLQLIPVYAILQGFAEEKVSGIDLPVDAAQRQLGHWAETLWKNYSLVPSEQLLRGRLDDCTKRLVHAQRMLEPVMGRSLDEAAVAKWRETVRAAYLSQDPGKIVELWNEDQWLLMLANAPDEELANPKELRKGITSDIVLGAVSEPLHSQCSYLLALRWQEKAERLQVQADFLAAGTASDAEKARGKQEARDAWRSAEACWTVYAHGNPLTAESTRTRAEIVKKHAEGNRQALAAGLRDYYQGLVRQAASAKLLHARALRNSGKADAAAGMLRKLVIDLEAIEKDAVLGGPNSLLWPRYAATLKQAELTSRKQ